MSRRVRRMGVVLAVLALSFGSAACGAKAPRVDLSGGGSSDASKPATSSPETLRIAVSAMVSPQETFKYYQQILAYVSTQTGMPVELVQRETYDEVNQLVRSEELEMAFVCTGAYVDGHDQFGMELLVVPVAYGRSEYHSYVIARKADPATSLKDFRGRRFAFTDPVSNTGKLVPTYMLGLLGETPESFFGSTGYTYSHDKSIEAVASGAYDGASVDSLVYDYLAATDPDATANTRIVEKSPPYGMPPVVVPAGLDPGLKAELRDVLMHMHEDAEGAAILRKVRIDRFAPPDDHAYDSVREMRAWLAEHD